MSLGERGDRRFVTVQQIVNLLRIVKEEEMAAEMIVEEKQEEQVEDASGHT
jgi:hypothetical protein